MAVSFNKEVVTEAIQEVLAEAVAQMYVTPTNRKDIKDALRKKGVTDTSSVDKAKPGEVIAVEEDHHENPNDDSDMAKSQLYAIAKYAIELLQMIKDGDPLDAWVQAKITKASDYIDAVQHYLEGEEYLDANQEESEEELDEGIGTIALGVAGGLALLKALKFIGGKVLKGIAHNVPLPKEKLLEVVSLAIKKSMQDGSSGINMFKIIGLKKFLEEKIEDGSITTIKQIKQVIEKAAKLDDSDLNEELAEGDYQARTKEDLVFQYLRDAWQFGATKGRDVNPDEELSTMADSLLANLPDYDAAEKGEEPKEKSAFEKRLEKLAAAEKERRANLKEDTLDELFSRAKNKIVNYQGHDYEILDIDSAGTFTLIDPKHKFYVNKNQMKQGRVPDVKEPEEDVPLMNLKEDDDVEPSKKDIKAAEKETGGKKTHFTPEAQNMHNIIKNKVTKIEKKVEAGDDYKLDLAALKQYISKPEVRKALGAKHIKSMVSSIISETITEGVSCCGRCGRVHESAQDCKKPYISKDSPRHCKNKK